MGQAIQKKIIYVLIGLMSSCVTITVKIRITSVHHSKSLTMPDWLPPAVQGGSGLLGGTINAISQGVQNKKNRAFSREMYERQYQDSLKFWNLQNEYNTPQAQMARFQAAGLNPALMYGRGDSGNAGNIPTPNASTPHTETPRWGDALEGIGAGISSYYDLQIKQAQTNNLQKQADLIDADIQNRKADTLSKLMNTDATKWDLDFRKSLAQINQEFRAAELHNLRTNTAVTLERNAREAAQNTSSLAEAAIRMAGMYKQQGLTDAQTKQTIATIRNLERDGKLKDIEIKLRNKGINPNDPMYARIISNVLTHWFDNTGELKTENIESIIDSIWNKGVHMFDKTLDQLKPWK